MSVGDSVLHVFCSVVNFMIRRKSGRRIVRRSSTASRNYSSYQPRVIRALPLRAVHYYPADIPSQSAFSNPSGVLLNAVAKGSSIYMRSGNRIKMLSLQLNGGIFMNPFPGGASAGPYPAALHYQREQNISLLVFYSPAPQVAAPPLSDYYSPSPSSGVVDTWSMRRVSEIPSMRLLKRLDYTLKTRPVGATQIGTPPVWHTIASSPPTVEVKISIPLNLMASYSNSTGTGHPGDITGGAVYIFFLGDYLSGASAPAPTSFQLCQFKGEMRVSFTNID